VGTLQGGANVLNEAQNMLLGIPNAIIAAHDYLTGDTWQQLGSQWSQNLVVPNDPAYSVSMGLAGAGLTGLSLGTSSIPGMVGYVGNAGNLVDAGTVAAGNIADTVIPFGPHMQGPLPEGIASSFRGGSYSQTTLGSDTTLFRVYGGSAPEIGPFWSRIASAGPLQSQIDLALNPDWGNTAQNIVTIKVPAGTNIYEGFAAPQGRLLGGGSQAYIPKVNPAWVIPNQ
jgi:hypothetical protein